MNRRSILQLILAATPVALLPRKVKAEVLMTSYGELVPSEASIPLGTMLKSNGKTYFYGVAAADIKAGHIGWFQVAGPSKIAYIGGGK